MISKKKSRRITVDGIAYRWAISEDGTHGSITVQDEQANGQRLSVDMQLVHSETSEDDETSWIYKQITPSIVADYITDALSKGWQPTSKLSIIRMHPTEKGLKKHYGPST